MLKGVEKVYKNLLINFLNSKIRIYLNADEYTGTYTEDYNYDKTNCKVNVQLNSKQESQGIQELKKLYVANFPTNLTYAPILMKTL